MNLPGSAKLKDCCSIAPLMRKPCLVLGWANLVAASPARPNARARFVPRILVSVAYQSHDFFGSYSLAGYVFVELQFGE
jgi:hypothetical protein